MDLRNCQQSCIGELVVSQHLRSGKRQYIVSVRKINSKMLYIFFCCLVRNQLTEKRSATVPLIHEFHAAPGAL